MTNFQNFPYPFESFFSQSSLQKLDRLFVRHLPDILKTRLEEARNHPDRITPLQESSLIIALSPFLESFLRDKFDSHNFNVSAKNINDNGKILHACKQTFIRRIVHHDTRKNNLSQLNHSILQRAVFNLCGGVVTDVAFAHAVNEALEKQDASAVDILIQYALWACYTPEGNDANRGSLLFSNSIDPMGTPLKNGMIGFAQEPTKIRENFNLCDQKPDTGYIGLHENSCLICHPRAKDTCRTGIKLDHHSPRINHDGAPMIGCPLDQKISEMIHIFQDGMPLSALATIVVDNPLVAVTGRRICSDCTNSCILHAHTPIDVPSIETHILDTVLEQKYGVEIYALLTHWNPLSIRSPLPQALSGHTILVAGQGPAGFGLAHHLMHMGHTVIAIDALRIKPINSAYITKPIAHIQDIWHDLDTRIPDGFGGVAEYGITARWDKNYLQLVRIILSRNPQYNLFDGLRLGSQVQLADLFDHGVSHVAVCVGTGRPKDLPAIRHVKYGVHVASDFLMHLNHGAYHKDLPSDLWIDFPLVVVGGGLTACDAATEALVYYRRQLEKFAHAWSALSNYEQKTLLEAYPHLKKIDAHLQLLENIHRDHHKSFSSFLHATGGVTIIYRGRFKSSPAYTTNKHEIQNALDQGVTFIENTTIHHACTDEEGRLETLVLQNGETRTEISARTLLVATGIHPNTHMGEDARIVVNEESLFQKTADQSSFFIQHTTNTPITVSQHGDVHPDYSGSVVKALASAKKGARSIHASLIKKEPTQDPSRIIKNFSCFYQATITQVFPCGFTPGYHVVIHAPAAVKTYKPGHFYRLNVVSAGGDFLEKSLALLPIHISKESNTVSFLIYSSSHSAENFANMRIGDTVHLMGPVGNFLDNKPHTHFVTDSRWLAQIAQIASCMSQATIHIDTSQISEKLLAMVRQYHPSVRIVSTHASVNGLNVPDSAPVIATHETKRHDDKTIILTLAPMQCMMKAVCGRCRVASAGDSPPIFACQNLWNKAEVVDWEVGAYSTDPQNPWNLLKKIK
ncbi:MAG: FAD-dependent oxidoreductase [Alphaproteobacteria bacterium]|nr:MAG: FAD-dependent oxidoreductase [Alphaproteobacteria bacterium]